MVSLIDHHLSINDEVINRLPQMECNPLLDEFPTFSETVKAIKLLSSGKAPGSDAIPAGIYKAGGPPVAEKLTVIPHYVEKRSHPSIIQGCNNYPPIHTERESSSLWQSSGHLFIFICWEDPCKSPSKPIELIPYQKANVDSEKTEEQLTWSSQQDSFKRNARNRIWTSTCRCGPY